MCKEEYPGKVIVWKVSNVWLAAVITMVKVITAWLHRSKFSRLTLATPRTLTVPLLLQNPDSGAAITVHSKRIIICRYKPGIRARFIMPFPH